MDWYPFYFTLYEQDTMHLNPYQDGCYRRLIDHYMKTRMALPDNDAALARIIGDSEANWVANGVAIVRPFFTAKNGRLYLKRCEDILQYQDKKTTKLSESGKKGAEKRWNKINAIDSHPITTPMGSAIAQDSTVQVQEEKDTTNVVSKKNAKSLKSFFGGEEFDIPQDWGDMAYGDGLTAEEINWHFTKFKNYWLSASGAKAAKKDWKRTWQNWYMQELERKKRKEELNGLYTKK